jgi:hypothetical protein
LQKPFSSDALTAAVRAVLDGRPAIRAPLDTRALQKFANAPQKFE